MSAALFAAPAALQAHTSLTSELQLLADRLRRVTVRVATTGTRLDSVGAGIALDETPNEWPAPAIAVPAHIADRFAREVAAR